MLAALAACVSTPTHGHAESSTPPPRVRTSPAIGALPAPEFSSLERERRRRAEGDAAEAAPPADAAAGGADGGGGGGGGGDSGLNFVMPGAAHEYLYSRASGATTHLPHLRVRPSQCTIMWWLLSPTAGDD